MCGICGCGDGEVRIDGAHHHDGIGHHHHSADSHHHDDAHHHHADAHHDHGQSGHGDGRLVEVAKNILAKNQGYADHNRAAWSGCSIFAINLISSPGAGKTTLLVETIKMLKGELPVGVVEGDQETANDADRIRATGVPAIQINTGKGCHLDAHAVGHAAGALGQLDAGVLFIENVGNLVCPSGFDLGEHKRAVLLSVTEGDDKPMKYPDAFAGAELMLVTKMDLAPYVDFNVSRAKALARELNPEIEIIELSAKTSAGMAQWLDWLRAGAKQQRGPACTN